MEVPPSFSSSPYGVAEIENKKKIFYL